MTIEEQIDNNIPLDKIPKSITCKKNYNYIRNNEADFEWKWKKERDYDRN